MHSVSTTDWVSWQKFGKIRSVGLEKGRTCGFSGGTAGFYGT